MRETRGKSGPGLADAWGGVGGVPSGGQLAQGEAGCVHQGVTILTNWTRTGGSISKGVTVPILPSVVVRCPVVASCTSIPPPNQGPGSIPRFPAQPPVARAVGLREKSSWGPRSCPGEEVCPPHLPCKLRQAQR